MSRCACAWIPGPTDVRSRQNPTAADGLAVVGGGDVPVHGEPHRHSGHDDCQCLGAHHCRRPGSHANPGDLGHYVLCRGRSDYRAADRLVYPALWVSSRVCHCHGGLWPMFGTSRDVFLARFPGLCAGAAGHGRWAADALVANPAAAHFSERKSGRGNRYLGHDHAGRPGAWPHSRWVDLR